MVVESIQVAVDMVDMVGIAAVGVGVGVGVGCSDRLQELQVDYWEGRTSRNKGMERRAGMPLGVWVGWLVEFWGVEAMDRRYA